MVYFCSTLDWINSGDFGHTVDSIKGSLLIRLPSAFESDPVIKRKAEDFRDELAHGFAGLANLFVQRREVSSEVAACVRFLLFISLLFFYSFLMKVRAHSYTRRSSCET